MKLVKTGRAQLFTLIVFSLGLVHVNAAHAQLFRSTSKVGTTAANRIDVIIILIKNK